MASFFRQKNKCLINSRLKLENKKLATENDELKQKIRKATSEMLVLVNEI